MSAHLSPLAFALLPLLGLVIGAYGTFIGAGGGFVLVPVLLVVYPSDDPATITSIALGVVFLNALSGTIGYIREGRIDYRSGALFTLAALPASVGGAFLTRYVPRHIFEVAFGVMMVFGAGYLLRRSLLANLAAAGSDRNANRSLRDASGRWYEYRVKEVPGAMVSIVAGFVSSFLGIGGGIIHVPAMVMFLGVPIAIAAATSHFILVFTSLTGVVVHVFTGQYQTGWRRTGLIGLGVLVGAQLGVLASRRFKPTWVVRILAVALVAAGARQIVSGLL